MDDIVKAAMAKWPSVPHCFGWLGLDARGQWWMRDAAAQACGHFASGQPGAKGSLLRHEALIAFIGRNYAADEQGRWFFQNGPQRVFVELEATPWVWRVHDDGALRSHTGELVSDPNNLRPGGAQATLPTALVDEHGHLYLATALGLGRVHTQDMVLALPRIESGEWVPQEVLADELPQRFGFVRSPQAVVFAGHNQHMQGDGA